MKLLLAIILLYFPAAASAKIQSDIEYGRADGEKLLLDANTPDAPGLHPIAILVHGGGWSTGDKAGLYHIPTEALSRANFAWFSINYRMAPKNRWPACFDDVKTAIRWAKIHASEYRGDASRVALLGYSAGGHLACLAATTADDDTRVQAVVGLAPPTDLVYEAHLRGGLSSSLQHLLDRPAKIDDDTLKILHQISPADHIHPGLPPFLLIQGDKDKSVPYSATVMFHEKLLSAGVSCDLITIKGAPHRIDEWTHYDADFSRQIADWLLKNLPASGEPVNGVSPRH